MAPGAGGVRIPGGALPYQPNPQEEPTVMTAEQQGACARIEQDGDAYILGETEDGLLIVQRNADRAVFLIDAAGETWRAEWKAAA
jgi:hypothetical protein